jgi:hypothetical protein
MPLQDPRDLPRVPGHLKRHPIIGPKTPGKQLDLLRLGIDPASRANPAILHDRDLTEIQVHIQPDRSHDSPCPGHPTLTRAEPEQQPSRSIFMPRQAVVSPFYMALTLTPPHDSENVAPSPEPAEGWRCTTMQAITVAAATIASAMYGNSL